MTRAVRRVLFVCGRARLRSPTAEQVFSGYPDLEVACAGVSTDADELVTAEHIAWADLVVVMERSHRSKIQSRFRAALKDARLVLLCHKSLLAAGTSLQGSRECLCQLQAQGRDGVTHVSLGPDRGYRGVCNRWVGQALSAP